MRRTLQAVVVAVGTLVSVAGASPKAVRHESVVVAEAAFPLPKDATRQQSGGKKAPTKEPARIQIYDVPRARTEVVAEVRAALKAGGWEITKDEPSPSGNAVRLTVKRSKKVWKASLTGDDTRAVIILTVP